MKNFLLTTLLSSSLLLLASKVHAQNTYSLGNESAYIEKMLNDLGRASSDSVRAYGYLRLSLLYRRAGDADKSKHYLEQGMELGERFPFIAAASLYFQALVEFGSRDIAMLEKGLLKADSLLSHFDNQEAFRLRGILWNNFGIVQQMKGDEKGAMDAFTTRAVLYSQKSGDAFVLAKAYKAIAIVFMNANQRVKASAYLKKAMDTTAGLHDDNPVNMAEVTDTYITAAENYAQQEQTDSAQMVLKLAHEIILPHPTSNLYVTYYLAEGVTFHKMKRFDAALNSLDKGIAVATSLQSLYSLNRLKYAKYNTLSKIGKYKEGTVILRELIESPVTFTTDKKIYTKELFTTYTRLGDTNNAVHWASAYIHLSDSLYEAKFQKDVIELEKKYRETENQKKIAALQAQHDKASLESKNSRLLNWLLALIILFLSGTGFTIVTLYRNSRKLALQREQHYQRELEDVAHRQQIQVAKALMQGEEMERKRLAVDLHDGLGGRLAGIKINLSRIATNATAIDTDLENVIRQLDISSNELRRIARNMMPESLLQLGLHSALLDMCDSLSSEQTRIMFQGYEISPDIPREIQIHIYRIVQELVTNSVRHAQATEILVQCSQNGNTFYITVEDNGIGFVAAADSNKGGIGLMSIRNRVGYLKGKLDIASEINQGTTVNIEFGFG